MWNAKSVVCVETHRVFESLSAAAKLINTTSTVIAHCCNYGYACFGYHFIWNPEGPNLAENIKNRKYNKRKVMCIENEMIFNSISIASALTGIDKETIYTCCMVNSDNIIAGGTHWKFIDD